MKKITALSATLCAALFLSGCGMGTTGSSIATGTAATTATTTTTTSALASTGTTVLGTLLSSLLGNTTTQTSIVGTWVYSKPKIAFESENILAQLGSAVASNKLESSLDTQFKKLGFTAGKTAFTFQQDGSCPMILQPDVVQGKG